MNSTQKEHYTLGLQDAVRELEMEIECCEMELSGNRLNTARYALKNGIILIQDLVNAVEVGL
jgi:hypothetical protein